MAEPENVADQALKKLADQLECAICLDSYTDPKLLNCFHVFCKKCLEPMVVQDQRGLSLRCPTCRQSTLLPAHGVSGLQPAFHVHHLFEIQDALKKVKKGQNVQETYCEKCNKKKEATGFCRDCDNFVCEVCIEMHQSWKELSTHEIISLEQLKSEAKNLVPPTKKALYCSKHPEKELDLYCETDEELICQDCIVQTHRYHRYNLVSEAFPKHRDAIASQLQPIKQQLSTINQVIQGLDARHDQIADQRAAIEADIHKRIQQLHEALEMRKTDLIGQLDQLTQQKLKSLSAQRDKLELTQNRLNSCVELVSESLTKGEIYVLGIKKSVVQQMKEMRLMSAEFDPDKHPPQEQADMKFIASNKLIPVCQQFGQVYCHTHVVCPEKCHITGEGVKVATVGEQSTVTVHAIDSEGSKCDTPLPDTIVSCELVCCRDAKRMRCNVRHTKANEYETHYQPTTRGRHELHIKVKGQHIRGSPFAIVAWGKLGTPIRTITGLNKPWGVAVNERGQIIVAENGGHCVSIYNSNGQRIKTFGQRGLAPSQFNGPYGVAVDRDGNILVADGGNHRIKKFTEAGKFMASVGKKGNSPHEFTHPHGIGIGPGDKIYVCDETNDRVQILSPDLTFSYNFGCKGSGDGQFQHPLDIAFDSHGNVHVADWANRRIQAFAEGGQFLRQFGAHGELDRPGSIAVDSADVVYVADWYNHCISLFTSDGHFLRSFGTRGNGPGEFDSPRGVAVDKDGFVYISDYGNNRLQIC